MTFSSPLRLHPGGEKYERTHNFITIFIMKKILLTILAASAIVACKKADIDAGFAKAPKTVEITIENGAVTKATTAPASGTVCNVADLTALFADQEGAIVESATFSGLKATDGKYTFTDLPSSVSKVAVIALRGNEVPETLAGAKALWESTEMVDAAADKLIVYGEDLKPTSSKDGDHYVLSASLTVVPNHARIEVSSISCTDMGAYSAIRLGTMTLAGYEDHAALVNATLSSTADNAIAGENLVWSWNIKEQETADIILDATVEGNNYTVAMPERTLTVNSYTVDGSKISTFENGNVYRFDIRFAASNLAEDGSATVSASVTVTISEWIINQTSVGFAN